MAIRRSKRGTAPVAAIDSIRTRGVMKDFQNAASLLIQDRLSLCGVDVRLPRGIQTLEAVEIEGPYPVLDVGKRSFYFLGDVLWENGPVFQDSDRFLPECPVLRFPPLLKNLAVRGPNESDTPTVSARL